MSKLCIDFRMHKASGIGRYISNIVPYLLDTCEITLLGNAKKISQEHKWSERVKIIECNATIYSIKEQFELFFKIPQCDIFWSPHYNIPLLPIRAKKRAVTIHDVYHLAFWDTLTLAQRIYAWTLLNCAVRFSDIILTVSEFSKSEIYKYLKTQKQISVVNCAVDGLASNQDNANRFDFEYMLYVGNVKPHKNLKRAIEAYNTSTAPSQNIKFVIVGKKDNFITSDTDSVLMENENVIFTGIVNDEILHTLYMHAKAFLFISLYEGFGIPPLEAQALQCPILVSRCASIPEICQDSTLYCDAYSVDDIVQKINLILCDNVLRQKLIKEGLENSRRFSWEKSARMIGEIFSR